MSWDVIGCACHAVSVKPFAWPQYFEEALCIAPATQRQPRASGGYARRSSAGKLCALRLPRKRQSRASGGHARRSSARRLCALRLTQPRASSGHARRSSARRLCVLRPPRNAGQQRPRAPQLLQEAKLYLCPAPATQKAARKLSVLRLELCVLHLPCKRQPRASGGHARRSSARRLCVLHLPRKRQPRASGGHARRSFSRRLYVLRLPRKGSRGQVAVMRAAAPPGSSVYCTCHAKGSRGPAAATRAAAPPGGSVYCACHAKGSQEAFCTAHLYCDCHTKPAALSLCTVPLYCACQTKPAAAQRRPRAPATRKAARKLSVLRLPECVSACVRGCVSACVRA